MRSQGYIEGKMSVSGEKAGLFFFVVRFFCPLNAGVLLLCLLFLSSAETAWSEPLVCSGYHPDPDGLYWSPLGTSKPSRMEGFCPEGQAIFSVIPPGGPQRSAKNIEVHATCCPLPEGILSNEEEFALERCPEGFVATGAKQEIVRDDDSVKAADRNSERYWSNGRLQYLRCTKLNSERYRLGASSAGIRTGYESSYRNAFEEATSRSRIPAALRYGLGRYSRGRWSPVTCVGLPWGSVLVGKESKYCGGFTFRQIVYKGESGDPAAGTAVPLYADCLAIEKPLSPQPRCILRSE